MPVPLAKGMAVALPFGAIVEGVGGVVQTFSGGKKGVHIAVLLIERSGVAAAGDGHNGSLYTPLASAAMLKHLSLKISRLEFEKEKHLLFENDEFWWASGRERYRKNFIFSYCNNRV